MTSGLQKGELIIIAARPSMGKTALAINIAQNAAIHSKAVVAVFSLEMSKESLLRRMLASQAWVDQQQAAEGLPRPRRPRASCRMHWANWSSRASSSTIRPASLWPKCAPRLAASSRTAGGLDLIVVDYLQLMSATLPGVGQKGYENRTQEVSAISRGLKAMAKELQVPVVALSQLSRASERRGDDKRPILSDLRESGSIEQDADVVAFIHRETYYNRDEERPSRTAKSEIIVAKQRNGPTDTVLLNFISEFTRFENRGLEPRGLSLRTHAIVNRPVAINASAPCVRFPGIAIVVKQLEQFREDFMDVLKRLFEQHYRLPAEQVQPLQGQLGGSGRAIVRLTGRGSSAIGILYSVREENVAFLEFSRHFRRHGLPVPEIYAEDLSQGAYLEEDLGDTTLFEFLGQQSRRRGHRSAGH